MRRMNLILLSLATSLPAALAGGCAAENPTSMVILGNTAPGTGCTFTAAENGPFLFRGVLDLDRANSYVMFPTILSGQQTMAGEPPTAGLITLTGAHVEISGVNSEDSLAVVAAMGPTNTIRDPEDCAGVIDDLGICAVTLLDATQVAALDAAVGANPVAIRATVEVQGQVRGNGISSNTFQWQIEVCRGCLVNVYAGPCTDIMDSLGDPACFIGQDRGVICCNEGCFNPA